MDIKKAVNMSISFEAIDRMIVGISHWCARNAFDLFTCESSTVDWSREIPLNQWSGANRARRWTVGAKNGSGTHNWEVSAGKFEGAWPRGYAVYVLSTNCQSPEPWFTYAKAFLALCCCAAPTSSGVSTRGVRCIARSDPDSKLCGEPWIFERQSNSVPTWC